MPLKLGKWKMNNNGVETELNLEIIGADNIVQGYIILGAPQASIAGYWDEVSQTFTFGVGIAGSNASAGRFAPVLYKGFLFRTPVHPSPGQDIVWTLAVFFQYSYSFGDSSMSPPQDLNARRNTFGWFAQITETV